MLRLILAVLALVATTAGCQPLKAAQQSQSPTPSASADPNAPDGPFKQHGLTIYGYNYTDFGIYSFEVNRNGGGNLYPSTATSAGGSSVCCFSLYTPLPTSKVVKIKWSRGLPKGLWCEMDVPLRGPLPARPKYLEVHFYQDGRIELEVSEWPGPPRLELSRFNNDQRHSQGNVINDDRYAECKHGY
jgi:hypothetical protein